MSHVVLRSLVLAAAVALLIGAGPARAAEFHIPMGPVDAAAPQPVRLGAADRVGGMVFARYYRPSLEDAVPERVSVLRKKHDLPLEDWLREWGAVQIQQIGRPF